MEFIFELILELLFEGSMELSTNKKTPKWLRIILAIFIILFMLTITIGLIVIGLLFIKSEPLVSVFIIIVGSILLIGAIIKLKKIYFQNKTK